MLKLYNGNLNVEQIFGDWHMAHKDSNYGAFTTFAGIVRDENGISGLSFDIYKPLLFSWFNAWQEKTNGAIIEMAHSIGDVDLHKSSFACAILSPKRRVALELLDEFVEDFKASAPIWKYDLKNNERIYAKDRSAKLPNAGILS